MLILNSSMCVILCHIHTKNNYIIDNSIPQWWFCWLPLELSERGSRLHWANVDLTLILLARHWTNIGSMILSTESDDSYNTLRPRQNGRRFADDNFKCILLNENLWISIKISLKFVRKGLTNNIPALVQIMTWRRLAPPRRQTIIWSNAG